MDVRASAASHGVPVRADQPTVGRDSSPAVTDRFYARPTYVVVLARLHVAAIACVGVGYAALRYVKFGEVPPAYALALGALALLLVWALVRVRSMRRAIHETHEGLSVPCPSSTYSGREFLTVPWPEIATFIASGREVIAVRTDHHRIVVRTVRSDRQLRWEGGSSDDPVAELKPPPRPMAGAVHDHGIAGRRRG